MHRLTATLILAAEESGEGSGLSLVLPHRDEVIAGIIAQVRSTTSLRASMRAAWAESGGGQMRTVAT